MFMANLCCRLPQTRILLSTKLSSSSTISGKCASSFTPSLNSLLLHRCHACHCIATLSVTKESPQIRSPQLVALEYADLNIPDIVSQEFNALRVRQHVNPLSTSFTIPVEVPEWNEVFKEPKLPLMVDIGSDPHFKKRHHKRRVVQKPLVDSIVDSLMPGGKVFIQSDVLEVALEMRKYFDMESDKLLHVDIFDSNSQCDDEGWLLNNPMGIRTEREIHAQFEGARIYRRMYQKQV